MHVVESCYRLCRDIVFFFGLGCDHRLILFTQGFFGASVAREGHIVALPPFENYVPLVLTPYCLVFLKACPKLDHTTHFSFHGNCFRCFKVAQNSFVQKPLTKDTAQMALFLVLNESATAKIALWPI